MKFFNKKRENSPEFRLQMAKRLAGRKLRYVGERLFNEKSGAVEEIVVAKDGFIYMTDDGCLAVKCDNGFAYRAKIIELQAAELLSLEGVILDGFDLESGRHRKIVAYYVYHRK